VLIRSMAQRYDGPKGPDASDTRAAGKRYAERLRSLTEEMLCLKPLQERHATIIFVGFYMFLPIPKPWLLSSHTHQPSDFKPSRIGVHELGYTHLYYDMYTPINNYINI